MSPTAVLTRPNLAPPAAPRYEDLVRDFLAGRNERTRRAYAQDLEDFRVFLGAAAVDAAVRTLLLHGAGAGNALALRYRNHLADRGLAPATVGRRLAALRSVTRLARVLGLVTWSIEIKSPKAETLRDTRGPGLDGIRAMLAAVTGDSPKARRDRALIRLLHDLGLRRAEAASLDLAHLDGDRLLVLRKGKTQRQPVTVPPETRAALDEWIASRGSEPGPLFTSLDNRSRGHRLSGHGIRHVVRTVSAKAGCPCTPHALRHSSITTGLDRTNGNLRAVAKFAGHANIQTTTRYDDNRQDLAGRISKLVAAAV